MYDSNDDRATSHPKADRHHTMVGKAADVMNGELTNPADALTNTHTESSYEEEGRIPDHVPDDHVPDHVPGKFTQDVAITRDRVTGEPSDSTRETEEEDKEDKDDVIRVAVVDEHMHVLPYWFDLNGVKKVLLKIEFILAIICLTGSI